MNVVDSQSWETIDRSSSGCMKWHTDHLSHIKVMFLWQSQLGSCDLSTIAPLWLRVIAY